MNDYANKNKNWTFYFKVFRSKTEILGQQKISILRIYRNKNLTNFSENQSKNIIFPF